VDMKLEVVVVPVADVDKAKDFYQGMGWRLDADVSAGVLFDFKGPSRPRSGAQASSYWLFAGRPAASKYHSPSEPRTSTS
jgi:catechol 2,3-dioxygenase-like lactoylglutathione lyase family enzyme